MQEKPSSEVVFRYLSELLAARDGGLLTICIDEKPPIFISACIGTQQFLRIAFNEDLVTICAVYPRLPQEQNNLISYPTWIAGSQHYRLDSQKLLSNRVNRRRKEKIALTVQLKMLDVIAADSMHFNLFHDGSIQKLEFMVQKIITTMKYMVTKRRERIEYKESIDEPKTLIQQALVAYEKVYTKTKGKL